MIAVVVRRGHRGDQRDTIGVGEDMDLRAVLASIDRAGTGQRAPFRPHVRGVEDCGGPVQVPAGAEPVEDAPVQFVEYPGCRPGGEATMCGRDADSERRWQVPPRAPAGEHVDDRGEHRPIVQCCPAADLRPGLELG